VYIRNETVSDVNIGYLVFHLVVYILYLIGLIYYWITIIYNNENTPHQFLVSQSVRTGLACLSMIGLALLFYKLCYST